MSKRKIPDDPVSDTRDLYHSIQFCLDKPIIVEYSGVILDGCNRRTVCEELCKFGPWKLLDSEDSPI